VDGYGDFCPLARAAEVYATRWTPLIIRNLLLGCRTFTEIRAGLPNVSRSVLTQRLRLLEHHGLIARDADGRYSLTQAGEALEEVTHTLGRWGERWLEMTPAHYDAAPVLWHMCKYVEPDELPEAGRLVFRFDVEGDRRYWLLLQRPAAEICSTPPGYDEDLVLRTSPEWLTKWHVGALSLGDALHAGLMELRAPTHLERLLAGMGGRGAYEPQFVPA
jgi:DNA-binding HxlR family transcriptional regulator